MMARPRPKLFKKDRMRIYRRDDFLCQNPDCGVEVLLRAPHDHPRKATLDHVVRFRAGGATWDDNLRTYCNRCNQERG